MKRVMFAAVAIGAAFLLTVCRGSGTRLPGNWDEIKRRPKNESAVLSVALQGSRCVLAEDPEQIRARLGHRVAFVIAGSCNQADQITIGQFRPDADPFEGIAPVAAQDGQVLNVRVKPQPSKDRGLWQYEVLINGNPAGSAGQSSQSRIYDLFDARLRAQTFYDFAICPSWPCN